MNICSRRSNMSQVHKTYKKRIIVINRARLIIFISMLLILIYPAIMFAVGRPSNDIQETYIKVYVEPGDTLWSIAKTYLPSETDIRDYINNIKKTNHLHSSLIIEGDYILVPLTIQP